MISFWTKPIVAAINAVRAPTTVSTPRETSEHSIMGDDRIIKYTPAVTIVAAWIKAETGVGPSMASGNHVCNPNWADLPTAPTIKHNPISVSGSTLLLATSGVSANTVAKSKDRKLIRIKNIAKANPMSPILFTTIALIAALLACIRVNQKLISK